MKGVCCTAAPRKEPLQIGLLAIVALRLGRTGSEHLPWQRSVWTARCGRRAVSQGEKGGLELKGNWKKYQNILGDGNCGESSTWLPVAWMLPRGPRCQGWAESSANK